MTKVRFDDENAFWLHTLRNRTKQKFFKNEQGRYCCDLGHCFDSPAALGGHVSATGHPVRGKTPRRGTKRALDEGEKDWLEGNLYRFRNIVRYGETDLSEEEEEMVRRVETAFMDERYSADWDREMTKEVGGALMDKYRRKIEELGIIMTGGSPPPGAIRQVVDGFRESHKAFEKLKDMGYKLPKTFRVGARAPGNVWGEAYWHPRRRVGTEIEPEIRWYWDAEPWNLPRKKRLDMIRKSRESNWHPTEDSVETVMIHETGHVNHFHVINEMAKEKDIDPNTLYTFIKRKSFQYLFGYSTRGLGRNTPQILPGRRREDADTMLYEHLRREMSDYSSYNGLEIVAETFQKAIYEGEVDEVVWEIYKAFGGPDVPGVKLTDKYLGADKWFDENGSPEQQKRWKRLQNIKKALESGDLKLEDV